MTADRDQPLVAVPMGDAAGIGPELVLHAMQDEGLAARSSFLVLGGTHVLQRTAEALGVRASFVPVESADQARETTGGIPVLECEIERNPDFRWGESNAINGMNAIAQIRRAVELAQANEIDGVAIAPLNKEAMHKAGFEYPDEIAFLGALAGTTVRTVVTWNGIYRSSVTGHVSLRAVPDLITQSRILPVLQNLWDTMGALGVEPRRIGIAGLNPHAGEDGAFGDEEIEVIAPAIEVARASGISLSGPHPGDTIFVRAMRGEFNGIVFMYHDQGNIPMKTAAFGEGVILYSGLPFPCAGPTHGSAYEIAGQAKADPGSFLSVIDMTLGLCARGLYE